MSVRLFISLLRWDVVREIRRRDTVATMTLFAILVLFVGKIGIGQDPKVTAEVGPVLFWIAILFAGTIGLSQTFAAEREGNHLGGIVMAPVDLGFFYLVKVVAVWLYVSVMEVLVLAVYVLLYGHIPWDRLGSLLAVVASFTLAYMAPGVIVAAMTSTLRGGGEVVLRILLIPVMLPVVWLTLRVSERVFDAVIAGGILGPPLELGQYLAFTLALCTIYLTSGYLLFPKLLEE